MTIIRKLALAGTCAVTALAFASPAAAVTNFFNDFESGAYANSGYDVVGNYEGWAAESGAGIEVQFGGVAGASYSGKHHIELDSNNNSAMGRSIDQGVYTLSFFYSDRPNIFAVSNGIDVLLNGAVILSIAGGNGATNTVWTQYTVNVNANLVGANHLSFAATGTSDSFGGYIDDVSLAAVPEPATWGLMLLGFGVVGSAMRRRETRVSFA